MKKLSKCLILFALATCGYGYSVLSHEAMIDVLWDVRLKPILLERFPNATPQQLKQAHSYAYGGAIIQDMGYYPHANGYFSDLTHYARSGDFIDALLADSQTLDEYAFALGALSHYAADNDGHRFGTNIAEPYVYPKLRRKFGNTVTYADDPTAHLRTEYAFDVEQVAKGNYASQAYHDFIGFNVAAPLLERAFRETYGFELKQMFGDFDEAVGSYRHTLSTFIPFITRVAWADHADEIRRARPGMTKRRFLYTMRRSSYEREWGKHYDHPSLLDRILAFIVKLLPPIGHIKILKFRTLTPPAMQLLMKSFDVAAPDYRREIDAAGGRALHLENKNFDVGVVTHAGEYSLQDLTYAYWLDELQQSNFADVTPAVQKELLRYYSNLNAPIATQKHRKDWERVLVELSQLRGVIPAVPDPPAVADPKR